MPELRGVLQHPELHARYATAHKFMRPPIICLQGEMANIFYHPGKLSSTLRDLVMFTQCILHSTHVCTCMYMGIPYIILLQTH